MQFQGFEWQPRYMSHYSMPEKYRPLNCLVVVIAKRSQQDQAIFLDLFFNKTIILLTIVGYETIKANSALRASLDIYHLTSNARSWNSYLYHPGK